MVNRSVRKRNPNRKKQIKEKEIAVSESFFPPSIMEEMVRRAAKQERRLRLLAKRESLVR